MCGEFDQAFEVGEIADPPVARRADAVELDREQPAAVEIAAEGLCRGRRSAARPRLPTRHRSAAAGRRPRANPAGQSMTRSRRLAFRDNLTIGNDFPAHRERWPRGRSSASRRPPAPDHHRLAQQAARGLRRQGIEDDFQRRRIRHTAVTLTIDKFGLNSAALWLWRKGPFGTRFARNRTGGVAKLSRYRKRIAGV